MKIGTKSVLFGAHQFLIHPVFVFFAWWKLYGFPWNPRLWIAFFVHDLGYWGKPNMDGPEGDGHVYFGAEIMGWFFDRFGKCRAGQQDHKYHVSWYCFSFYHSRFMAKRYNVKHSTLCVADKLAIALEPWWLYLPRVILSGEIREYMALADSRTEAGEPKYASMQVYSDIRRQWFENVKNYLFKWVDRHKDGKEDTWTPDMGKRVARDGSGVWK